MRERERWVQTLIRSGFSPADAERAVRWYEQDQANLTESQAEMAGNVSAVDIEAARAWWVYTMGLIGAVRFTRVLEASGGK